MKLDLTHIKLDLYEVKFVCVKLPFIHTSL